MERDDFTAGVKDALAKRVGVRRSNPGCEKPTAGPREDPHKAVNIGVAAHITAAAEGGPRFDARLSEEQRQATENGIWLCQNCAKLIDNDVDRYSVELLVNWKQGAEGNARRAIEGENKRVDDTGPAASLEISYRTIKQESERHDYQLTVVLRNVGTKPLPAYHIDVEFPARAVHELDVLHVPERDAPDMRFFRLDSEKHRPKDKVYPGDAKRVIAINYFVDQRLFRNRGDLFDQIVKATLYAEDLKPICVEARFEDLQRF